MDERDVVEICEPQVINEGYAQLLKCLTMFKIYHNVKAVNYKDEKEGY